MKAVEVENLTKVYGKGNKALDGVSFSVDEGEIFGLLGPNGAGKTTTIKIITTLIKPTHGTARVFGTDVLKHPQQVRQMMGYVPQAVSVDADLTGYENLLIFSKLFYVDKKERQDRISEALDFMELTGRADDLVKHYSGGMMRRLEIAQALVNRPRVLFLDEPSIGLDPFSKSQVKDHVKALNKELNMTMFVTTHDMTEADDICDRVAIMNAGRIAVIDTPTRLKESVGGDIITVKVSQSTGSISVPGDVGRLLSYEGGEMRVLTESGEEKIPRIIDHLEAKGVVIDSISLAKPTLDDVFIKYAGSRVDQGRFVEARSERRNFARRVR
ncbi:MAG: ATP-binding cassette domain-containing protein [Nitrososphaerales archaeon]